MSDPARMSQIHAVQRGVGELDASKPQVRTISLSQTFEVARAVLWQTCTYGDQLGKWFLPISGDLRLGGRFEVEDNATGVIEDCQPTRFFSSTWEYDEDVGRIELELAAEGESQTRLIFRHISCVEEALWGNFGPGALGIFWDIALMRLAVHLSSESQGVRVDLTDWAASMDGYRFLLSSSQSWCAANISVGADPVAAQRAADRAMTAYRS
jgi:uncharacterized protein YndB with AHSA1/START domain